MDDYGIRILDSRQKEIIPARHKTEVLTTHGLERTTDPVKLYLREMGNISLLTREGEITIARKIERGEKAIIKALSRTRFVLNSVLALEDKINDSSVLIQDMFDVTEDDIVEGKLEEKKQDILLKIRQIRALSQKLEKISDRRKSIFARGRIISRISRLIRDLNLRSSLRERIIEELKRRLKKVNVLEEEREELKLALKKKKAKTAEIKSRIRHISHELNLDTKEIGLDPESLRKAVRTIARGQEAQRPVQEGAGRGQSPAGRVHRQEIQQPRPAVP